MITLWVYLLFRVWEKKVKELNLEWFDVLRAMNNKFSKRTILETFTCDKCYQYFDCFMNYLFKLDYFEK